MQSQKLGERFAIRLTRGEEIVSSLTQFLVEQGIAAASIHGIGAADLVTLRYYDMETKGYHSKSFEGKLEIASLTGNVSLIDAKPWPHLHIVLADTEYRAFGGHLESARVSVTCELFVEPFPEKIERVLDSETGLKLWKLL